MSIERRAGLRPVLAEDNGLVLLEMLLVTSMSPLPAETVPTRDDGG